MSDRAVDRVYDTLRREIVSGGREPGARLGEEQVARDLSVSRTPVRAALERLAVDGFVEIAPHRGCIVRSWSRREISEIYEVRVLLEGGAARLAARHRTDEDLERLSAIRDEMEQVFGVDPVNGELDVEALSELNKEFHTCVIKAGRNGTLLSAVLRLLDIAFLINTYRTLPVPHIARSIADHRALIDALEAQDENWAAALMQTHILAARNRLGLT